MNHVQQVTDDEFEAVVLRSDIPVLVDFWAPWCGPCLQIAPVLEAIATERRGRLRVVKLNVDENPVTAARYRITGMPTLHLFIGGDLVRTVRGAKPKQAIYADLGDLA